MARKILCLILFAIIVFSLIACRETPKNTSLEENQVSTGENKEELEKRKNKVVRKVEARKMTGIKLLLIIPELIERMV